MGSTAVALVAAAYSAAPAFADDEGARPGDTIVVTATFRETDVQDTPISITAVNSEMMDARSQTNVYEIAAQAPNVTLKPGAQSVGSALVAYIRGVGQTDFNLATEPGVGLYVDDVYYSSITGNLIDLLDLERVEVLRGPQGTLAGRNSIGGAIKMFTRKPTGDGDGFIEGTYGTYDRVEFRGGADFTIVDDKLFGRISGVSRTREGFVDVLDFACVHADARAAGLPSNNVGMDCQTGTLGGESYTGGRFALRWLANDRLEANFSADIINDQSEAAPSILRQASVFDPAFFNPAPPSFDVVSSTAVPIYFDVDGDGVYDADNGDLIWQPGEDIGYDNRFATMGPFAGPGSPGEYTTYSTFLDNGPNVNPTQCAYTGAGQPFDGQSCIDLTQFKPVNITPVNHLEAHTLAATFDYDISPNFSFKSITAYRSYENTFTQDQDGSPLTVQQLLQVQKQNQLSEEFRLNGTVFDDMLDFTVGAFWQDRDGTLHARVDLPYTAFDFIHGPDPTPSETTAGFIDGTLHLNDRLDISAGVRYTEDEKSYTFMRHNPDGTPILNTDACVGPPWIDGNPFIIPPAVVPNPVNCAVAGGPPPDAALNGLSADFSSERTDYRVAVSFDVTDDIMAYAQTSTGYKGGGINARPFVPDQAVGFDPETLEAYEVGVKTRLFDNRARVNASYFFNDYTDIILTRTDCSAWVSPRTGMVSASGTCLLPFNAGDAEVQGFELEAEIYPTDEFLIDLSISSLDFEYTAINISPSPITLDMIAPYTPELTWSLGAQYEFDLGGWGSLTPRVDASYQDEVFSANTNDAESLIDDYTITNARVTWRSPDDTWSLSVFGTNLGDEFYYLTFTDQTDTAGLGAGRPGRPQEFGVTLRRNF